MAKSRMPWWSVGVLLAGMFGMLFPMILPDNVPPDPNDPLQNPADAITIVRKNLASLYFRLEYRRLRRQITVERRDELMREEAERAIAIVRRLGVKEEEKFEYGEILRTAREWEAGAEAFRESAAYFKGRNVDLAINSLIRQAHCYAELGEAEKAVRTARETFSAPPGNKPSILLAVYLEIAPALYRVGKTEGLPELIEGAMRQHAEAVVDVNSTAGVAFEKARRYHIVQAAIFASQIYTDRGQTAKASAVMALADQLAPPVQRVTL